MAAIAHVGVGLAAKPIAPKVPTWALVASAWVLDLLFMLFWLAGIERFPAQDVVATSPYSHGLFMAVIWSVLAAFIAQRISRTVRTSLVIGLLVFSHWIVDFISHPMTAVFPDATGLPLLFAGSPTVGLGLWRSSIAVNVGEYGTLIVGTMIYILTLVKRNREKKLLAPA